VVRGAGVKGADRRRAGRVGIESGRFGIHTGKLHGTPTARLEEQSRVGLGHWLQDGGSVLGRRKEWLCV
jgi:hypothetical protein